MSDESSNSNASETNDSLNLVLGDLRNKPTPSSAAAQSGDPTDLAQKKWLFEKRLDYAFKFFDHHAKQRMSMFSFFLVFIGFIFGGYASLARDGHFLTATALAIVGAVLSAFFFPLERRNEELVHIAEDVLEWLEKDCLFADYDREILSPHRRHWGWFPDKPRLFPLGIFRRQRAEEVEDKQIGRRKYTHGFWLPWFQMTVIAAFLTLAYLSMHEKFRQPAAAPQPLPSQNIVFPPTVNSSVVAPVHAPSSPSHASKSSTAAKGRTQVHHK